jgi:hypothetical protein
MAGRHNRLSTEPEPTNLADIANDTSTTTLAVFLPAQHLTKQKIAFRSPETKAASVGDSTADLPCVGRRCSGRLPFSEASPGGGAGAVRSGAARRVTYVHIPHAGRCLRVDACAESRSPRFVASAPSKAPRGRPTEERAARCSGSPYGFVQ